MREIVARISQAVRFHVHGSAAVLEAAFPRGVHVNTDVALDLSLLRSRFWVATSMHSNPNDYVYYGNKNGQSIALKRVDHDEVELRLKTQDDEHRTYYRYRGIYGTPKESAVESNLFDPRTRLWYRLAQHTPMHIWTTVYIDFSSDDLVVTRAKRVLNEQDQVEGVVATDVSLKEINQFISALNLNWLLLLW